MKNFEISAVPTEKLFHTTRSTNGVPVLPGADLIGTTYDIANGKAYPNQSDNGQYIFDWDTMPSTNKTVPNVDGERSVPGCVGQITNYSSSSLEWLSGSSLKDMSSQQTEKMSIDGHYGMFKASLNAGYSSSEARSTSREFASMVDIYDQYVVQLKSGQECRQYLQPQYRKMIDNSEPNDLFKELGTHIVRSVVIGGQVISSTTTDKSKYNSDESIELAMKASYNAGIGSVTAKGEYASNESYQAIDKSTNSRVEVVGGDDTLGSKIFEDGVYDLWLASLRENPAPCAFPSNAAFMPIWELAEGKDRRDQLKAAMNAYLNDQRYAFPATFPLQEGDQIAIKMSNGLYTTTSDPNQPSKMVPNGNLSEAVLLTAMGVEGDQFYLYDAIQKKYATSTFYQNVWINLDSPTSIIQDGNPNEAACRFQIEGVEDEWQKIHCPDWNPNDYWWPVGDETMRNGSKTSHLTNVRVDLVQPVG